MSRGLSDSERNELDAVKRELEKAKANPITAAKMVKISQVLPSTGRPAIPGSYTLAAGIPSRVKEIKEAGIRWDDVMANAMAQYEVGRLEQARFLLEYAREIRAMALQDDRGFEALRRQITEQA